MKLKNADIEIFSETVSEGKHSQICSERNCVKQTKRYAIYRGRINDAYFIMTLRTCKQHLNLMRFRYRKPKIATE